MGQPGDRSREVLALVWLGVGAAMVLVPGWLGWTRWQPLLTGHPLGLVLGMASILCGVVALAWAVATLLLGDRPDDSGARSLRERELVRRARRRLALAVPSLALSLLVVGVLAWSRPLPAHSIALAAMRSGNDVRVADRLTWYELVPAAENEKGEVVRPTTGLVFVPGARVDPRAYGRVLRPLAQAGYLVAVLKEPLGLALLDPGHARRVITVHPDIDQWVVGGHSLGGVAAASFADAHPQVEGAPVAGLVLYAAYPAGRINRADLEVTSISGDVDGLTTPADIDRARDELPPDTRYVIVPGAVHSFFGDYGEQSGDGTPTADRAAAQAEIAKATRAVLAAVTPKPQRK